MNNGSVLNEHYQIVNALIVFAFDKRLKRTNLYLDNLRETPENFERVYNYEEFVNFATENGVSNFISFDHDLGEGRTDFDCAKFLVEYSLDNDISKINFQVHSQNPLGKENIEKLLGNFNWIS